MRSITVLTVVVLVFAFFSVATGEVPAPKQEINYDHSGPCKDLIGMWTGNLSTPESSHNYVFQKNRTVTNWDFNLYVTSINDKTATGIYCWSFVGKAAPGCTEVKGTFDPGDDKLVFQWGERTLTLFRKPKAGDFHQAIFQKSGGGQFEGLAKKMEK
jgi:hypothetical protein